MVQVTPKFIPDVCKLPPEEAQTRGLTANPGRNSTNRIAKMSTEGLQPFPTPNSQPTSAGARSRGGASARFMRLSKMRAITKDQCSNSFLLPAWPTVFVASPKSQLRFVSSYEPSETLYCSSPRVADDDETLATTWITRTTGPGVLSGCGASGSTATEGAQSSTLGRHSCWTWPPATIKPPQITQTVPIFFPVLIFQKLLVLCRIGIALEFSSRFVLTQ